MAMISLLVCSRILGNKNWGLFKLLESLKQMSANYANFEVLIKFDSDDRKVRKVLPKLDTYPFKVKYIIEPRGRGYIDLHVFYNRLYSLVDEKCTVVGAMGDDFEILIEGWDEQVIDMANTFPDQIFIIHDYEKEYQEQGMFEDFDLNTLEGSLFFAEAPLWSRKLLEICGGLGHVSFTDAWTVCLEYYLYRRCGLNRTLFFKERLVTRRAKQLVDGPCALRWWTDRANNFAFMRSDFYKTFVEQQAVNIYCYVKMAEKSALPAPLVLKESDYRPAELPSIPFGIRVLNSFPFFMRPRLRALYCKLASIPYLRKLKQNLERRFFHHR